MQKKIIALAVAAAFSAPAFADNANVTIYGKAFLTLDSIKSNQTGAVSKMRINSNASRFGLKGSEDVGDGLKAIYQFEVQMDGDGSGGNGLGNGTRNTAVGLAGGFGEITLGYWDTPYKVTHNKIELFDNTTVFSATNLIGKA
jgi:predicted porin